MNSWLTRFFSTGQVEIFARAFEMAGTGPPLVRLSVERSGQIIESCCVDLHSSVLLCVAADAVNALKDHDPVMIRITFSGKLAISLRCRLRKHESAL